MKPSTPPFAREAFGTLGSSFEQPSLPESVSWSPSTPGAWITLGFVALALLTAVWRLLRRYRRRAPRREALRALRRLERRAASLTEVAVLLKVVALSSFDRPRVAPLSGEPWRAFLVATGPGSGFEGLAGDALITLGTHGTGALSEEAIAPLFAAAQNWIQRHRVSKTEGPT